MSKISMISRNERLVTYGGLHSPYEIIQHYYVNGQDGVLSPVGLLGKS
jgi:hypothetical protein